MTTTPQTLRIQCTEDLIAASAVVLGFYPADDVVMITADGDHVFHARTDLPVRPDPGLAAHVAEMLVEPAVRNGVRRVAFAFFSDDERVVSRVWSAIRRGCAAHGIELVDAFRADGRRYYPLQGERWRREVGVAYDVGSHPFVVEAVLHGQVIERNRAAVVARAAPDRDAQRAVTAGLERSHLHERPPPGTGAERLRWGRWLRLMVEQHVRAGTSPSDEEVGFFGWAVQDLRVRDAAWALIEREDAAAHESFWLDVTRRVPDRLVPGPAALLGWAAWQAGHGALAWVAVDRCREVAPDYALAAILARCLDQAIPPDRFRADFPWDEGLPA
jgi:hypothetical protein